MGRLCTRIMVFSLVAAFVTACAPAPTPAGPLSTAAPTAVPTSAPTAGPAMPQTAVPPVAPTGTPTQAPTAATTTRTPTAVPTMAPTAEAPAAASTDGRDRMKIRLSVDDRVITATLTGSKAAQDFASMLPLTLTFQDYSGTEKISDLPKRLTTAGEPSGSDPSVGDIAYYAPWGNLALFYRDFGYSSGLVILGKIDRGMEAFDVPGSVNVTIERIE